MNEKKEIETSKTEKKSEPKIFTVHDEATLNCPCGQQYIIKNGFKLTELGYVDAKFDLYSWGKDYDIGNSDGKNPFYNSKKTNYFSKETTPKKVWDMYKKEVDGLNV